MSQKLANATALYLEGIRDGNVRAAVEAFTGDRYTQHSTGVADGVEGFVEFFEPFVENNPGRDIRVVRSIVDGTSSMTFSSITEPSGPSTTWVRAISSTTRWSPTGLRHSRTSWPAPVRT